MRRAAFVLALAASACTVGPNYKRPVAHLPEAYRGAAPPGALAADQPSLARAAAPSASSSGHLPCSS